MSEIENIQRWVDIANTGVVIALALSFLFSGTSIFLSRKLDKAKNIQRVKEKQTSDFKIEEARAVAATANERTAKLSQENIKLRTDLETATAETRSRQSELTVEQQKLAEAERKRAEAQLALEKTLDEIRRRQKPRTLSPEQRLRLVEILKTGPKGTIEITCVMGDGEGYAFATEIDGLLKAAGWNVVGDGVNQAVYSNGNPIGVGIVVHSQESAPQHAIVLQQAFSIVGYPIVGSVDSQLPKGKVLFFVGNKPQ